MPIYRRATAMSHSLRRTDPVHHACGDLPQHLGLIPDGNRRWSKAHRTPARIGHQHGIDKIPEVLGWCHEANIPIVTLFTLSVGNLARDPSEQLLDFLERLVTTLACDTPFQLHPIGRLDLLPATTHNHITQAAAQTRHHTGMTVNLAIGYTGRLDILTALQAALHNPDYQAGAPLTEELINQHISTAGQPDPDLIIRTSGEQRLSGFLTWQAEQAELYFCRRTWPNFRRRDLHRALDDYQHRHRRYGT